MQSSSLITVEDAQVPSRVNPFINTTPGAPSACEWVKIALLLPLAIVRVLLALVFIVIGAPFAYLSLVGYDPGPDPSLPVPLSCWRKALYLPMRLAVRGILACLGFMWVSVKGNKVPSSEAPLLLPNHMGFVEPLYLMCRYGVSHVAKAETKSIPVVGALGRAVQQVYVRRSSATAPVPGTHTAREVRDVIGARGANMGANGYPTLCLYPEATTTNGQSLIHFKLGAFHPGVPVQPCVVRHSHCHFDPSMTEGRVYFALRMLTQFWNALSIEFLPVVVPTPEEKQDPVLFAARVRQLMAEALRVPLTEHALSDFFLLSTAKKGGVRPETAATLAIDTPVSKLKQMMSLTEADLTFYMQRFTAADTSKNGALTLSEFETALDAAPEDCEYVAKLFAMFDQDGDNALKYAEFVAGLLYINAKIDSATTAKLAFQLFDKDGDGKVYRTSLSRAVEEHKLETIDQPTIDQLFLDMDPSNQGWVSEAQAVSFVQAHPEVLSGPRKTALLQRFAGELLHSSSGGGGSAVAGGTAGAGAGGSGGSSGGASA